MRQLNTKNILINPKEVSSLGYEETENGIEIRIKMNNGDSYQDFLGTKIIVKYHPSDTVVDQIMNFYCI